MGELHEIEVSFIVTYSDQEAKVGKVQLPITGTDLEGLDIETLYCHPEEFVTTLSDH